MTAVDLSALADYTRQLYIREQRRLDPPRHLREMVQPDWPEHHAHRRTRARAVAQCVERRDWLYVLDGLGWFGQPQMAFLERAFPLMAEDERADYLRYTWCKSKGRPTLARVLRLFEAATRLRSTVPDTLPTEVTVYRGSWSASAFQNPYRRARRWLRSGISWTTDCPVARRFAGRLAGAVGCVGTAVVPRSAILAYFHDRAEAADFESYHEHECIVAPQSIRRITYERVERGVSETVVGSFDFHG